MSVSERIGGHLRWGLSVGVGLLLLLAGCGDDDAGDPVAYFEGLEASQVTFGEAVDGLFVTPTAQELDSFAGDEPPASLTVEQETIARRFLVEFWEASADAAQVHHDEVDRLTVPDSIEERHDAYVTALHRFVATSDERIARAQSTSGVELLGLIWEPGSEVEAVDNACEALHDEAARLEIEIDLPVCARG